MAKWKCQDCEWETSSLEKVARHDVQHSLQEVDEPEPEGQKKWEKDLCNNWISPDQAQTGGPEFTGARWMIDRCVERVRSHVDRKHQGCKICNPDCLIRDLKS